MMNDKRTKGLPLLLAILAAAPSVAAATPLTQHELAAALAGEVPVHYEPFITKDGRHAGRGVGAIVIERPAAEAWAIISHFEDKAEYVPRLRRVTVHEKTADSLRCTMEVDFLFKTQRYTAWYRLEPAERRVRWTLDRSAPDNDLRDVEGDWQLEELGTSRTLLVYRTFVDPGKFIPGFTRRLLMTRSLPDVLRAFKHRVESAGR